MHLLQLPTDIVIVILSNVKGVRDLLSCDQVCKAIHSLFKSSPRLSHSLGLARAGLIDGSHAPSEPVLNERSKLLRVLEQSWYPEDLRPRRQLKVAITDLCTKYQVCDGVVVSGILAGNGQHLQSLQVYRLQSYITGHKAKLWKHDLTGANIEHCKADPAQDLLVLVEGADPRASVYGNYSNNATIKIHLRTLSSNRAHPAACFSTLQLNKVLCNSYAADLSEASRNRIIIRIHSDILGVFIRSTLDNSASWAPGEALGIWQWTSGQRLLRLLSDITDHEMFFSDFTFIDRDQILFVHPHTSTGPAISTMRFACGKPYSTSPTPSTTPIRSFKGSTIFQFPAPPICARECIDIPRIEIINEPISSSTRTASTNTNPVPNMFMPNPSPESTIIGFSILVRLRATPNTFERVVNHTLLARASLFSPPPLDTPIGDSVRLAYDEWSTRGIHWFSGPAGYLYGQRYAYNTPDLDDTTIEIYDFNPCHVVPPASGWQALIKIGKGKPPIILIPKMSLLKQGTRTKCNHKYYLDHELKSSMQCKRQTMRAGITYLKSVSALDSERIILIGAERGGFLQGFTAYNI